LHRRVRKTIFRMLFFRQPDVQFRVIPAGLRSAGSAATKWNDRSRNDLQGRWENREGWKAWHGKCLEEETRDAQKRRNPKPRKRHPTQDGMTEAPRRPGADTR